jgi:choline dehydrogenase
VNERVRSEVDRALSTELPECEDWTAVNIHQKLLRIIAMVSGSVFLGPELCQREEYLYASIMYTVDFFEAVRALKKWSYGTRWLARYIIPQLSRIQDHEQKAKKFLTEIIKDRTKKMAKGEPVPDDMLQWMMNKADKFGARDDMEMARNQLLLSMASIHTTTMVSTNM